MKTLIHILITSIMLHDVSASVCLGIGVTLWLAGCGSEGAVQVQLVAPANEIPPPQVVTFSVVVRSNGERLAGGEQQVTNGPLTLPSFEWQNQLDVHISGLDGSGAVAAYAAGVIDMPDAPTDCCATLCYCQPSTHTQNKCNCGSSTCAERCSQ